MTSNAVQQDAIIPLLIAHGASLFALRKSGIMCLAYIKCREDRVT